MINHQKQSNTIVTLITIILTFFASGIFFNIIAGFLESMLNLNNDSAIINKTIFRFLSYIITAIIICMILKKDYSMKISQFISIKKFDVSLLFISFLAMKSLQDLSMQVIAILFSDNMQFEYTNGNYDMSIIFILDTIIFSPIIEEIVFRFGSVEILRKKQKTWIIILLISIIFALLHTYNLQGIFSIFALSIILTTIYFYTQNLIYPITCHILNNAFGLIDRSQIKLMNNPIVSLKNGSMIFSTNWIIIQFIILIFSILYVKFVFVPKYVGSNHIKK